MGHSSIAVTQRYAKVVTDKISNDMDTYDKKLAENKKFWKENEKQN